jgi:cyclic beta-1,2-glucan synthetase
MLNSRNVRELQLDPPLRGEPFSAEHLWTHAEQLAPRQVVRRGGADRRLVTRFEDNSQFIAAAYEIITESARNNEPLGPDAEWLVDNYYIVEEQLREIREDLPRSFYLELPKLVEGPFQNFPRVYELAFELVVHTDSSLDEELIAGFIAAYQRKTVLTSGEIWAVPIMLRLVLVENLRRLCSQMLATRESRPQAERLLNLWQRDEKNIPALDAQQDGPVIVELVDILTASELISQGPGHHTFFERLGMPAETIDECVRREQQRLAANQVSIGNAITSMRLLTALDWTLFFERVSLVEQILRQDPAGVYPLMDFATRDQYRHEIERIAKAGDHDESLVAATALQHASAARANDMADPRQHHIGYYVIGEGQSQLECEFRYRPKPNEWIARWSRRHAAAIYLGGVAFVTGGFSACVGAAAWFIGGSIAASIALGVLSFLPASEIAVGLVNFLVTSFIHPRLLPKLDFTDEVPANWHTLVVMPTLLTSKEAIHRLLDRLEIHYLANSEPGLSFALLSDFEDSLQEETPDDRALLKIATAGVQALNERYSLNGEERFLLLHRRRTWNPRERTWMGWERKRGKLLELNRLLRGSTDTSFIVTPQQRAQLASVRFVITLDSDTKLPHAVASRLAGTLAHPLNRPRFDPQSHRVTHGYGVLQPRVSVSLASASRSLFAWIYSNSGGLDPYSTAVSDVYQDLFSDGSYTGKGIYDVDAFTAATIGTFPPDHILSHDLIEGCFARVGSVTDVELFDEYPTRVDVDARRQHRWIRGDWQLLPWLFPRVPTGTGWHKNPLTAISRWKIFDNLRRSLVPLALVLVCLSGWLLLPNTARLATFAAITALASPFVFHGLALAITWRPGQYWKQQLRDTLSDLGRTFLQCLLAVVFLPFRAHYATDAIVRTLNRLFISRRRLLEWETADAAERRLRDKSVTIILRTSWVPLLCLLAAALLQPEARAVAFPVLAMWFVSPGVAYYLSRPVVNVVVPITAEQRAALRRIARRTWSFFEEFVGPKDSWLPPDNFQEFPRPKIAHRISPTNEGLFVASAIAARDFGYLGANQLADLLQQNLEHWVKLERYNGHFFNWYDTTTLEPLAPRYVSTADSGNLAACFLTAHQAIHDILGSHLTGTFIAEGVADSVQLAEEALARLQPRGARFVSQALDALDAALVELRESVKLPPADNGKWWLLARQLKLRGDRLPALLHDFESSLGLKATELDSKIRFLQNNIGGLYSDCQLLMPWAKCLLPREPAAEEPSGSPPQITDPLWRSDCETLLEELRATSTLNSLATLESRAAPHVESLATVIDSGKLPSDAVSPARDWLNDLRSLIAQGTERAQQCHDRLLCLGRRYETLAKEMDFTLLYNPQRRLFSVGLNLEDGRLDRAHYDMLASEARIASLVAIAKNDAEHRHWFQLARALTQMPHSGVGLLSWGGTMFEYLMPTLFTRDVPGSLLERSCEGAVERQIAYGRQRDVPWGISESAFAAQAANGDYHYQSFGVPGLGLKRGLGKDLVISPYSTALALPIRPLAAIANFKALAEQGAEGRWGFYDALDYTRERVPAGERRVVVFCYMAHHQGMIIAALANFLRDQSMQRRFQRQPLVRSTELLLQERIPVAVLHFNPPEDSAVVVPSLPVVTGPVSRQISTPHTVVPRAHLLSNGQYSVMISNAGGGYSRCRDVAVTRWRADTTCDQTGQFVYLRDLSTKKIWSAGYHPVQVEADAYEVTYSIDKAEFRRHDGNLETHLEVTVSPEKTAEVRQITITNHGRKPTTVEITSYAELVLCQARADAAHPAFNKLFVETEFLGSCPALLARRRPRENAAEVPWAVHVLAAQPASLERLQFETDRSRFLGRGRTPASPAALDPDAVLSGTTGPVLDPIFSLRGHLHIPPDESASLAFMTGFAASREEAIHLADQFRDPRLVLRTFEMAWAQSQVELRHLHVSPTSLQMYQRLASALLYPDPSLRSAQAVLTANRLGQRSLWQYGISGDDPIVLLRVSKPEHRGLIRELLYAHEFWHSHGLKSDLVIVNEHPSGYFDQYQEQLLELINTTTRLPLSKSGGVYLLRAAQMSPEVSLLLQEVAAISLHGDNGSLARQVEASTIIPPAARPKLRPVRSAVTATRPAVSQLGDRLPPLEFDNHFGGFASNGDYVVRLQGDGRVPAPWSNIIANPGFGCLITESGSGYTWAGNSRENKLTSWSNDPVSDPPSEVVYLRDEETGAIWTPTPLPIRDKSEYRITHGRGYSRFLHAAHGIRSELTLSIAPQEAMKFICLKLRNLSDQPRSLSVTYFAEWVLSVTRDTSQIHVYSSQDEATGALTARNSYNEEFPDQVVFLHVLGRADSVTGDRTEFIGRNGSLTAPAALQRVDLSGKTGAGLDPCGAVQKKLRLSPAEELEVIFLFGWTDGRKSVADVLAPYTMADRVHESVEQTIGFWTDLRATIEIHTPNRALDLLVNHWLLYQTLSCRVWARSAFYQSGGAYGFRDQLQDVMALIYGQPQMTRDVILLAASRQFEEGDVQHWWHPPSGRGIRTRFSDDYLWLPLAVSHYVSITGDVAILNEAIPYLRSPLLELHEDERYELPETSPLSEDLYGHCLRAIDHAFRCGEHGLPLMGSGDWNDGMNRVGIGGQGESVWLAWFLRVLLQEFIPLVEARGDASRAATYAAEAERLLNAVEQNAWDGSWYRRAYFDDGTPVGSAQNDECQIDSLAQSWSVVAGGDVRRTRTAMQSADERLVRNDHRIVQLLDPPFDKTPLDPGYIKGYPPGIRENGGQYTHAATWFVQALTMLGEGTRAGEIFDLLNPIHLASPVGLTKYRVEPYVVAADVYSKPPHVGRGGWTWYTGSAGWMYRVAIESILGVHLRGNRLTLSPCIPAEWAGYEISIRRKSKTWTIRLENPDHVEHGITKVVLDGRVISGDEIVLDDNKRNYTIQVILGPQARPTASRGNGEANLADQKPRHHFPEASARFTE